MQMTDKQIIIDGVDVSGCENALQGKHTILCAGSEDRALCDANKRCLYKKYKAKEQECETLGQAYLETNELLQEKTKECTNLKAENDTLFKAIEEVNKINKRLESKKENYKQTLTEIKEIAEKTLNMVDYKTYFKRDNKSFKQESFKAIDKILQKISEVNNDK